MDINAITRYFNDEKAYVYALFSTRVVLGTLENGKLMFTDENNSLDNLLELRIFNKEREVKCIYDDETNSLTDPIVTVDSDYEEFVEDDLYLMGTGSLTVQDGKTYLRQQRKELVLPFEITEEEFKEGVKLRVKNYIGYNKDGIAYFCHSRFVTFIPEK
jgi:CRISPR-associated protein (TIGR03984 family)